MVFRITQPEQHLYLKDDGRGYIHTLDDKMSPLFHTVDEAYNFLLIYGLNQKGWTVEQVIENAPIHLHRTRMTYSLRRISRKSCV